MVYSRLSLWQNVTVSILLVRFVAVPTSRQVGEQVPLPTQKLDQTEYNTLKLEVEDLQGLKNMSSCDVINAKFTVNLHASLEILSFALLSK